MLRRAGSCGTRRQRLGRERSRGSGVGVFAGRVLTMLDRAFLESEFSKGMAYTHYVALGTVAQREAWGRSHERVRLTARQEDLIGSFTREMKVLVTSGLWCGDCSAQCPMLARIGEASGPSHSGKGRVVDVRFVDRDAHQELAGLVKINDGFRVPTVIFMAEDFHFAALQGDRVLSRYRAVAAKQLGGACPLPGAAEPQEELSATVAEWVEEFERVHLMLRLSSRLREKHGD